MIIQAVADVLELNGVGEVGEDIFIGELPFDKDACISLIYSPSPEPNKSIPYYTQSIDVWARFASYEDGYNRLRQVMDLFHQLENYEMGQFHVYLSYARGEIDDLDRDSERRHLFRVGMSFVYRKNIPFS